MEHPSPEPYIIERAKLWLTRGFDEETQARVRYMMEKEPEELTEAFYRDLEFGTGGLRGIMGVGTNRMNRYTVGMATQGLANYLKSCFPGEQIRIAIAHDSRNNSRYYAQVTANVLSSNKFLVFLFDSLRPTPELSFAVRYLKCHSGIVITASHNPKEYNGYKVYWNDGGQLVPPHDVSVIREVQNISDVYEVDFNGISDHIIPIGGEIDQAYLAALKSLSLSPEAIESQADMKIVYTALHGSGTVMVPKAMEAFGFRNISVVGEQSVPDGNFPTVKSPNPEEKAAMAMAISQAEAIKAALVLATDPDADRVGVAVRNPSGSFELLNGNQTASLLVYYLLSRQQELGKLTGSEFIAKTIVTSELIRSIADSYKVETFDVLTGFKWIAEIIRNLEGEKKFIGGGEESYGFLVGDYVRDKDAIITCCMVAEAAAWATCRGKSLYDMLIDIYIQYGLYKEDLLSITKKGKKGSEEIQQMMEGFRVNPPYEILGVKVIRIMDYQQSVEKDMISGKTATIDLPKSNVLQFFLEDGSKITARPSGTEPKIKFYFGLVGKLDSRDDYEIKLQEMNNRIGGIMTALGLSD